MNFLPSTIRRFFANRALAKAIRKGDMESARMALSQGAVLEKWVRKGPLMDMGIHCPGMSFKSKGVLEYAFYWFAPPALFTLLLQHGARPSPGKFTYPDLVKHAQWLDGVDENDAYARWVRAHGSEVAQMVASFEAAHALEKSTVQTGAMTLALRRL